MALFGFFALFNFVVGFAEVADGAITQGFGSSVTIVIVLLLGRRSPLRWPELFDSASGDALDDVAVQHQGKHAGDRRG